MEPDTFGRAALIVVDMQNDFVRRGAPLEVPGRCFLHSGRETGQLYTRAF